ncbi:MAG: SagB/ThcOx family dehydrogenase [Brevinematia bacterium]
MIIKLPDVKKDSNFSLETAIYKRRSIRNYSHKTLKIEDISTILWAGQGITLEKEGLRSVPSAGALYPIELYLVSYKVENLKPGVYKYFPHNHHIKLTKEGDFRESLFSACLLQEWIRECNASIVISAIFERTTKKYGERGKKYVYIEAGCVAQNIHLVSERLGIGTVIVGAFSENEVKKIISMEHNEIPIALMPLGYKNN